MVTQRRKRDAIMARLNQTQIYAIRWLESQGQKSDKIAEELSLTENQVIKVLEKNTSTKQDETAIKTKKSSAASRSHNLMIRQTAAKKSNNVSIMTKEASELNDSSKNQGSPNPKVEKGIFRPKSNG